MKSRFNRKPAVGRDVSTCCNAPSSWRAVRRMAGRSAGFLVSLSK